MTGPSLAYDAISVSVDFLEQLRPGGPWILTSIVPDTEVINTVTVHTRAEIERFIRRHNGSANLYYSVNPTRTEMSKKAAKTDIASIEFLISDLDPNEGESAEEAKKRYLGQLETFEPKPTYIVDSGNGIQCGWRQAEPIKLSEPIKKVADDGKVTLEFSDEDKATIADIEARIKALMKTLNSVAGTQNIDRILRLPGTTNLPNATKLRNGRVDCPTRLISFNDLTYSINDFPAATVTGGTFTNTEQKIDWEKVAAHTGWLKNVGDLPADFSAKGKIIVRHSGNIKDLNFDLEQAGLIEKNYNTWSDVSFALAAIFKSDGRFTLEQIAAALICNLDCNRHVTKQETEEARRRAVERALARSTVHRFKKLLNWRECKSSGEPVPSMHNARLAITAAGVVCSHDTFHNKLLFGYEGDQKHIMKFMLGEVTDNGVIALRQMLSDQFGFDLGDKYVRDAVISLANENRFDPVCDMLEEAQGGWDGVERLDRMAIDYFNCEDTPLNRAFVRKTMIAAVRRARHPGCKFDNILTLESKEGWNKSSAWRVLAGDDNFSDQTILGLRDKEAMELLGPIWIHESADLSGMRKADVDHIKAFASRQEDIARPAYGHFVLKQKRHCINTGTTNGEEYLQSQTGNRRFWPLRVLASIDLEKLRADRLQLWGEAAKYEAMGESLTITEELWPEATQAQEERRVKDPWESTLSEKLIPDGFKPPIVHEWAGQWKVFSKVILNLVFNIPDGQQEVRHSMRLATAMKNIGWERAKNKKITVDGKQDYGFFRTAPTPSTEDENLQKEAS